MVAPIPGGSACPCVEAAHPVASPTGRPDPQPLTSGGWIPMIDVAFVVLTIALFAVLALVLRGVERL